MKSIIVKKVLTDEATAKLAGDLLDDNSYDVLVDHDCDLLREDDTPLAMYREDVFTLAQAHAAHRGLREAARGTRNRGTAAGPPVKEMQKAATVLTSKTRYRRMLDDGTISKTIEAETVHSGIVGAWDRSARTPYCRLTAFTMEHPEKFAAALPLIQRASEVFQLECPDRWEAQRRITEETSPDFVIPGTVFTTVTVNKNWQTAVHQDAGDYKAGFGVMTALRFGRFTGGYLCFPQYRVAVDMRTRGLLLADVHEWHGNTPLKGQSNEWERISLVLYYRNNMKDCGSHADELKRAQHRKVGESVRGKP